MADSASQLVDRLVTDAQFRQSLDAAPSLHAKAEVVRAAGFGDVNLEAVQEAAKQQLTAMGAGVQVDPARARRVEELFHKTATDRELQQALQAASTPEATRDVLAQAGYGDITLDDLRAAAADIAQREELTDEELDLVAGGTFLNTSTENWAESIPMAGLAGARLGAAFGPQGAGVGAIVGIGLAVVGTIVSAIDPPPPSDW